MSDRGIYGVLLNVDKQTPVMIIGQDVPRVHHSDGMPVYLITEHPDGIPAVVSDGTPAGEVKHLIAYPSHWPGPGQPSDNWIVAAHTPAPFNVLIPCFDREV